MKQGNGHGDKVCPSSRVFVNDSGGRRACNLSNYKPPNVMNKARTRRSAPAIFAQLAAGTPKKAALAVAAMTRPQIRIQYMFINIQRARPKIKIIIRLIMFFFVLPGR